MAKKIILAVVAIVAVAILGFAGVVAMQPNEFSVERSATMAAPPAVVFAQVNDFHAWQQWSPWAKLDPNAKDIFEGSQNGEGAIFRWDGNDEVGAGKMTIVESVPSERILLKLEFTRPMEDTCDTLFTFQPEGDKTKVTWKMSGESDFIGKAVCMFMNMDQMVGSKFEEGLASMKAIAEAEATAKNDEGQKPKDEGSTN